MNAYQPREEGTFISGAAAQACLGRMKVDSSKEGAINGARYVCHLRQRPHMTMVGDSFSSVRIVSVLYQPQAIAGRAVTVLTNTPTRSAQSSPGDMQGIAIIEPILANGCPQAWG